MGGLMLLQNSLEFTNTISVSFLLDQSVKDMLAFFFLSKSISETKEPPNVFEKFILKFSVNILHSLPFFSF